MSTRTAAVLERFPGYIAAGDPGKLAGHVVDSVATDLDVQSLQLRDVRRSHRLPDAPTVADVVALGGLHDLDRSALALARRRLVARETRVTHGVEVEVARQILRAIIETHTWGNATVVGLLNATAAYLATAVVELDDRESGYWHLARVRDLLPPDAGGGPGGSPPDEGGAPSPGDLLALEENPPVAVDIAPARRRHGDRMTIVRSGFDTVSVSIVIEGIEDRTVRPMVVALHAGAGLVFTGSVAAGSTLRFEADGRATVGATSVTRQCWRFDGAVFADDGAPSAADDFCWSHADTEPPAGSRGARFSVATPVDAFTRSTSLPHADDLLRPLSLPTGESRWATFVGAGAFAGRADDADVLPQPDFFTARWDAVVLEPDRSPEGAPSLSLGWEWEEREPFALRVWLPTRYADLDVEAGSSVSDPDRLPPVREVVRTLLQRHRAAGVHVYTDYADPRWILGTGVLRELDTDDALGLVVAGTEAWDDNTAQPELSPRGGRIHGS